MHKELIERYEIDAGKLREEGGLCLNASHMLNGVANLLIEADKLQIKEAKPSKTKSAE